MSISLIACHCALHTRPHGMLMPCLAGALQEQLGGAERDAGHKRTWSWYRGSGPPASAGAVSTQDARGPLDDPNYSERVGGLPEMGWEKAVLRDTLGQDIYK